MSQLPLPRLPGATEGTTQWRAEKLQMVNWGGFHGHAQMPVAATATLLSGASGTGKSTLLDGYLALVMPSDTPFNGASNDATTGRARGAEQRNLLTYLRGKLDSSREAGTGELTDQVLRGVDAATWGAIAMTFVDDNRRRFTVLRVYLVPRGVTRPGEIIMKMATMDGTLDLRELQPLAQARFDKRALTTRWPQMTVHHTYAEFSQTLFTRLGIGAGGDGAKALRLLARIQGGHQIRTVDGLYKSMVLEEPATYPAADLAANHFAALDASYQAMQTEADKVKVLGRLPDLYQDLDIARATADMIDTFGIHREGDSPFLLWQLRTERRLLRAAVDAVREQRDQVAGQFKEARALEGTLNGQIERNVAQQRANGGDVLETLKRELEDLEGIREQTTIHRTRFEERTASVAQPPSTADDFQRLQENAQQFLAEFEQRQHSIAQRQEALRKTAFPLSQRHDDLREEHKSLQGRTGLVPRRLHEARLAIAHASGIDPDELPFAAELMDLAPGQEQWRKAAEVTLFSVARLILVDQRRLDHLSRAIDPIRLPIRVRFEGVELRPYRDDATDPRYVSGKLIHKDSPFSAWVQDRVRRRGTDALCVDGPGQLRGDGARVTLAGQTRDGSRGAHGDLSDPPIIGFSNAQRIAEIETEIEALAIKLGQLGRQGAELEQQMRTLYQHQQAHQHIIDTDWASIDLATVEEQIRKRERERDRILAASDVLRVLQDEYKHLEREREEASRNKFRAEQRQKELNDLHSKLAQRQDTVDRELDRIDDDATTTLSPAQAEHLDVVFVKVGNVEDLDAFRSNVSRLKSRLAEASREARDNANKATEALCGIFETYQARWEDPNLGTGIDSYTGYREILDNIVATGLHERRQEWRRRLSEWSGQDLVPLNGAFDTAIEDIEERLAPVNAILASLPFGPARDRLRIVLRRLSLEDVTRFRRELKALSSGITQDLPEDEIERRFQRLREFMKLIRPPQQGAKTGTSARDMYLDVRKHVEITAVRVNAAGIEVATYASLGGKSGGETQELVAFIVGAALRFQLGDEDRARPRFAPVFLDEGFVKSDSEFAGRAVNAWKGLGFQLIVGAPLDKVTALEPDMELVLTVTKSAKGYSHITELRPAPDAS